MGLQTLEAGEKELNRLRKLKLERMGDLMLASREKIQGNVHTVVAVFVALRPVAIRRHVVGYCQQRDTYSACILGAGARVSGVTDMCVTRLGIMHPCACDFFFCITRLCWFAALRSSLASKSKVTE